jgi:hypothetical protein
MPNMSVAADYTNALLQQPRIHPNAGYHHGEHILTISWASDPLHPPSPTSTQSAHFAPPPPSKIHHDNPNHGPLLHRGPCASPAQPRREHQPLEGPDLSPRTRARQVGMMGWRRSMRSGIDVGGIAMWGACWRGVGWWLLVLGGGM